MAITSQNDICLQVPMGASGVFVPPQLSQNPPLNCQERPQELAYLHQRGFNARANVYQSKNVQTNMHTFTHDALTHARAHAPARTLSQCAKLLAHRLSTNSKQTQHIEKMVTGE